MSRHLIRGRQLSRDTEHRKALRRGLAQSLFEHGKIKTTLPKAKEVQSFVEKLITEARRAALANGETASIVRLNARRKVVAMMQDRRLVDVNQDFIEKGAGPRSVVEKLFNEVGPKFTDRSGGYTRIIKLPKWRIGDGGMLVSLELVTEGQAPKGTPRRSAGLRRKRADRKRQFANRVRKAAAASTAAADPAAAAADTATA